MIPRRVTPSFGQHPPARSSLSVITRHILIIGALALVAILVCMAGDDARPPVTGTPPSEGAAAVSLAPPTTGSSPMLPAIVAGTLRLEGQAIDEQEQPIAGATITLAGARTTTSEVDGSFAFDGLAPGSYNLSGERGLAYGEIQGTDLDDTSEPVMLQMRSGPTLTVHVVTASRAPVANAAVKTRDRDAITDAAGVARLRAVELDRYWIEVHAAGFAPIRVWLPTPDDAEKPIEHTIVLASAATVAGIVIDDLGRPVDDARILIEAPGDTWSESVHSDAVGAWHVDALGPGRHAVRATGDTFVDTDEQVVELDGVHPRTGVVVRVVRGAEIAGIVVDTAGKPVAGAGVTANRTSETTDEAGHFTIRALPAGTHDVVANTQTAISPTAKVTVERAGHAEVRLVISPSSIAGVVRDPKGHPIADAFISARETTTKVTRYERSDEHGQFDFGGIAPGTYDLTAERPDEPSHDSQPGTIVRTPARDVVLVVPDSATLIGRVLLDGKPVPYFGFVVAESPTAILMPSPTSVRSADGRFAQRDLPPGTWGVVIAGPGFAPKVIDPVAIAAGATVDLGDIAVDHGRVVTGRVTDERGGAIAGARVVVTTMFAQRDDHGISAMFSGGRDATSGPDGSYRIEGVDPKGSDLKIQAMHDAGWSPEHALDADRIDLVIAETGSLGGVIENMASRQIAVAAKGVDRDDEYMADLDAAGSFEIAHLPAGTYDVRVVGHNALAPVRATVTAGQRSTVVFEMPKQPVTLVIHKAGCHFISLETADEQPLVSESCDRDAAELTGIAPGSYQVCADFENCQLIEVAPLPEHQDLRL